MIKEPHGLPWGFSTLKLKTITKIREETYLVLSINIVGGAVVSSGKDVVFVGHVLHVHIKLVRLLFTFAVYLKPQLYIPPKIAVVLLAVGQNIK
ncbi:MAG: hypothetical protein AB3N18_04805 [Allomuricauda sp.]